MAGKERLQEYADIAGHIIVTIDKNKKVTFINKKGSEILGYKKKEIIGKNWFENFLSREVKDEVEEVFKKLMRGKVKEVEYFENPILTKSGKKRIILWHNSILKNKEGKITGTLSSGIDITRYKRVKEALRRSEDKFRLMIQEVKDYAIFMLDAEGIISSWNEGARRIKGYNQEEIIGKHFSCFYTKEDVRKGEPDRHLKIALAEGRFEDEGWRVRKDGSRFFARIVITPLKDENDKLIGFTKITQDITDRKQTEEKLRESEEKYRTLVEKASDGICIIQDGKLVYLNNRAAKIWGGTVEELIGKSFTDYVSPNELPKMIKRYKKRIKGERVPERYELTLKRIDGRKLYLEVNGNRVTYKGKPAVLAIIRDITERKKAEEKIKKLYSLQKVIREINQVLIRIEDKFELFQKICEILLEIEDFKFCCLGFFQKETSKLKLVAYAGGEGDCLSSAQAEKIAMIIKEKEAPVIINDIEKDPSYSLWGEEVLKRGYKSSIIFPLFHYGEIIGVLGIFSSKKDVFRDEEVEFLKEATQDIVIGIKSLDLEKQLREKIEELNKTTEGIIYTVAKIVETKDPYTSGHQKKVAKLASAIAEEMNLPQKQIKGIYMAATIHDIGKIYVPAEILSKPGKLTKLEFYMIKTHSEYGYNMLKEVDFPWPVALTVLQHHERVDGSGYPLGLFGKDIILEAKILAVADVVEAISSYRPYRAALGLEEALEEIEKNKGKLYDPEIVNVCVRLFKEKGFEF